jgi:hypothetical protein
MLVSSLSAPRFAQVADIIIATEKGVPERRRLEPQLRHCLAQRGPVTSHLEQ